MDSRYFFSNFLCHISNLGLRPVQRQFLDTSLVRLLESEDLSASRAAPSRLSSKLRFDRRGCARLDSPAVRLTN